MTQLQMNFNVHKYELELKNAGNCITNKVKKMEQTCVYLPWVQSDEKRKNEIEILQVEMNCQWQFAIKFELVVLDCSLQKSIIQRNLKQTKDILSHRWKINIITQRWNVA